MESPLSNAGDELSPWSKIRAMARGSEDPVADPTSTKLQLSSEARLKRSLSSRSQSPVSDAHSASSDSDDIPTRPIGRMAARMLGNTRSKVPENASETSAPVTPRHRRRLISRKGSEARSTTSALDSSSTPSRQDTTLHLSPTSPQPESFQEMHQPSSPGLFVSPAGKTPPQSSRPNNANAVDSDSDAAPSVAKARFQELLVKKRAERKAREEERLEAIRRRREVQGKDRDAESEDDEEAERRLTQQSRPARKASKKALEEMNRETQRMSRNQQLDYEAKVRKKVTKQDLFKKFNFRQDRVVAQQSSSSPARDEHTNSGAMPSSDVEGHAMRDTPPTSPPTQEDDTESSKSKPTETPAARPSKDSYESDGDLPTMEQLLSQPRKDKGKAPVRDLKSPMTKLQASAKTGTKPKRNIRVISTTLNALTVSLDSDDELEVLGDKARPRLAVFDQVPVKKASESMALLRLRTLAHVTSSSTSRSKGRSSLTTGELHLKLAQKAREQAILEKQVRIQELKAKGIIVLTEEEREKEQLELENLLERARREAHELAKKEKAAAAKGAEFDTSILSGSEDEDADWEASDEEDEDENAADDENEAQAGLSSSDDEEATASQPEDEDNGSRTLLLDDAAAESQEESEHDSEAPKTASLPEQGIEPSDDDNSAHLNLNTRRQRKRVIQDDEDEEDGGDNPSSKLQPSESDQPIEMSAFGFNAPSSSAVGLTQLFRGTMADLNTQATQPEEDSMDIFRQQFPSTFGDENSQDLGLESQVEKADGSMIELGLSQFNSQAAVLLSPTRFSEIDPTQDAGFEDTQIQPPVSTVDTVVLPISESPIVKRKGRLRRYASMVAEFSDPEEFTGQRGEDAEPSQIGTATDAFQSLFKAAKKSAAADAFHKKSSKAKAMVAEQAEESEDEYAGLGGASDDDSDDEVDEEVAKMIDESHVDVNERELAQFFADKERADDEKQVDKLYRDITTGLLRRKRGVDLDDLSDSEDEAAEHRRRKQLEFARMRKALLEDENIGKIGTLPFILTLTSTNRSQPKTRSRWHFSELLRIVTTTQIMLISSRISMSKLTLFLILKMFPNKATRNPPLQQSFRQQRTL